MSDEKNYPSFDETNGLAPGLDGDDGGYEEPESHGILGNIIAGAEKVFGGDSGKSSDSDETNYGEEGRA